MIREPQRFETLLAEVRRFVRTECMPLEQQIDRSDEIPEPLVQRMRDIGLFGHSIPQAYGGAGLTSEELSLGHPLLASMHVRQAARPLMEELARQTGCTVNLGMRDRANVVYIDTVRADRGNRHLPDIGSTRPLLATSIGRALILACPAAERCAILNHLKVHDKALFEQHRGPWEADQKLFAEHGFCHSRGDWQKDVHAVAVPVRLPTGEAPVAINVPDPCQFEDGSRNV